MDSISGIYEVNDMNALVDNILPFSKFDRSIIIVNNANGLQSSKGIIKTPLAAMYYIKPGRYATVDESIMFISHMFNEHTPITIGGTTTTLYNFLLSKQI